MVDRKAASVRPRVMVPDASEAVLLEDEVRTRIEDRQCGIIELVGARGAGKSASISHLANVFGVDRRLHLVDCPSEAGSALLLDLASDRLVVCASPTFGHSPEGLECWRLAPWGQDEWIEYLLAIHPDRCASVMRRIQADPRRRSLGGVAGLWCVVLDRLAADESLNDLKSALCQELDAQLPVTTRSLAGECAFAVLNRHWAAEFSAKRLLDTHGLSTSARTLLRHAAVTLLLAAEYLIQQLRSKSPGTVLQNLPERLVREAAEHVNDDKLLIAQLRRMLASRNWKCHAMAASLLHAADVGWIPLPGRAPTLDGAFLHGASWPGIRLKRVNLAKTDLTEADLSEARLSTVHALLVQMSGAVLHGAQLRRFMAPHGNFADADLSFVRAPSANFFWADLRNARLEGALLRQADFSRADLRGANCRRADMSFVDFRNADLTDADFSGANLSYANLSDLGLQGVRFVGARFDHAMLCDCNLENVSLPGANFAGAVLQGAYLTASQMPGANFLAANLSETGLAEIDWPQADLRNADLRGATFHMGSSRSGLVGSPLACEGSRTGFYTDEYHEQEFKSPEEIRKANLCGADLRGARIDDVDFYLVDLRGARYTPDQEGVFRRSGAILEARV